MGILNYQNGVTQWLPEKAMKKILKYFWDVYAQKKYEENIFKSKENSLHLCATQVLINRQVAIAHNRI